MELKAVNEYKAPEYSTYEESRNNILRLIMNCKKVSAGILAMFLFCSNAMAVDQPDVYLNSLGRITLTIEDVCFAFYRISVYITAIVYILYGIISTIIYNRKIKETQDEEERNKKRKKRNKLLLTGAIIAFLIPILVVSILYFFIKG